MTTLHAGLNPAQQQAVTAPDGPLLVIAGAGSGKTRTIVHRLAYLVEEGVPASSLLLLTFTRKASQEMLYRATKLLGTSLHDVCGGTFHGFAYRLLRRHKPAWATGPITILDSADNAAILKQCRDQLKIAKGDRSFPKSPAIISLFSKARNKERNLYDILQNEGPHLLPHVEALTQLFDATCAYRRSHNILDYDDLLFECEALLRGLDAEGNPTLPPLAEAMQREFSHLLVDEYQDTNKVQARIVQLLAGERANIMAVGDDAQSIYAFRGATVRNILDFPKLFPSTTIIRLEENYRSVKPILDVANAILADATEGYTKVLFTSKEGGEPVRLLRPMSDITQAQLVARRVETLLGQYDAPNIAVLFRSGYQSYHIEVALSKLDIAFRKYGGMRYSEAAHIKDVLAFVRLCINPLDRPSFERIAALCEGIGPKTAHKIFDALTMHDSKALAKFIAKYPAISADIDLIETIRNTKYTPAALLGLVIEQYEARLPTIFPDDWPRRAQGLEALAQIATTYTDIQSFVADLSLDSPDEEPVDERKAVVLSTIHSAKGLEWDAVIILDLVEDRFPSHHAMVRPEDFEEERRLMYVAVTRARHALDLSVPAALYSRQHKVTAPVNPSPFIQNLPHAAYETWQEGYGGTLTRYEEPQYRRVSMSSITQSGASSKPSASSGASSKPSTSSGTSSGASSGTSAANSHNEADLQSQGIYGNADGADCGFCHHKIFGRGKIIAHIPPDKCRVNFPGVGLKVIMRAFLTLID